MFLQIDKMPGISPSVFYQLLHQHPSDKKQKTKNLLNQKGRLVCCVLIFWCIEINGIVQLCDIHMLLVI